MISWLNSDPHAPFPPVESALRRPDGLLAAGGDLSIPRLLNAYSHGIFPWYEEGQPILWWSPDPRCVLFTDQVHVSRRLQRRLRRRDFELSLDQAFEQVVAACAAPRDGHDGTWITAAMLTAYTALHQAGHAHSLEVWNEGALIGGIYGVAIGRVFFGESMFSAGPDGSKIALVSLCRHLVSVQMPLLDCQVFSTHLESMGASMISRSDFTQCLALNVELAPWDWRLASQSGTIPQF